MTVPHFSRGIFCFSEEQRKGKERGKGLVYHTLPQMKLCSFNILPACASLPHLVLPYIRQDIWKAKKYVSSLQNLHDITVSTRRTCHFLTLSRFSFLNISWRMLKMPFLSLQISKFSGRTCPQVPYKPRAFVIHFQVPPLENTLCHLRQWSPGLPFLCQSI